ncbi:hypothetical protein U142_00306, partial [Staphylococcus aureus F41902]
LLKKKSLNHGHVYTMAYIDDGGGEVFFNYTKQR